MSVATCLFLGLWFRVAGVDALAAILKNNHTGKADETVRTTWTSLDSSGEKSGNEGFKKKLHNPNQTEEAGDTLIAIEAILNSVASTIMLLVILCEALKHFNFEVEGVAGMLKPLSKEWNFSSVSTKALL